MCFKTKTFYFYYSFMVSIIRLLLFFSYSLRILETKKPQTPQTKRQLSDIYFPSTLTSFSIPIHFEFKKDFLFFVRRWKRLILFCFVLFCLVFCFGIHFKAHFKQYHAFIAFVCFNN